jgi:microsomal dipeptidase-like Zn-dependent dipeptidase
VIGYEILKHFKIQKQNKEKRKNKKSFNDQRINIEAMHQELVLTPTKRSKIENEEEEVKSAKDYDSKHLSNSVKTIEKLEMSSFKAKSKIKVIKNSSTLTPQQVNKSKYSKMLHFSNLKNLGSKLNELKELHKNYFLINYFNSSTVNIYIFICFI